MQIKSSIHFISLLGENVIYATCHLSVCHSSTMFSNKRSTGGFASSEPRTIKLVLQRKFQKEPLGIVTDEELMVTKIQTGSVADGKLELGDVINHVNGLKIGSPDELLTLVDMADRTFKLTVIRDPNKTNMLQQQILPPERERNVTRRLGFEYFVCDIEWQPGCKLGLVIKSRQHRVLVSRVDEDSVSCQYVRGCDRIIDVNGMPVSDKNVAKEFILHSLQDRSSVSLLIERPKTEAALRSMESMISASETRPQAMELPYDVQEICRQQRERMRQERSINPRPILCRPSGRGERPATSPYNRINIRDEPENIYIQSDLDPRKILRKVRRPNM